MMRSQSEYERQRGSHLALHQAAMSMGGLCSTPLQKYIDAEVM
jgi:hypothetical protein